MEAVKHFQLLIWLLAFTAFIQGQQVKFLLITESAQPGLNSKFTEGLKVVQDANPGAVLEIETVNFTRRLAEDAYQDFCNILQSRGPLTAVIDMAWGGWIKGRKVGWQMGIPYVRAEAANHPFVKGVDDYLTYRQSIDAALVFPTKFGLDQALYYIIGNKDS